ncbi:hypothetical protein FOCG_11459 [Fusarium oxysporum f. sp. radicis-lycopersici 26381]|uniref:Uncharacterized protein n=2 Tax=Fusarium oxysporum TaxID=5507 RepID=W9KQE2_FUSOX|nr:hypothetical protein FOZG_02745 [Fusarium oxysporum Fo47]EXL47246.1 hypothetical protein FOCG_11459 [Fusarium oxysporum f. sp. radicis-lycopersici 26381]
MRNKHWVTISSRKKDTVNSQGRRHSPHVILQENPDSDPDGNDPNHTLQCRLDEHDGPQPPFGPPPSPIKHRCRNLEPLSPLIANHLRQSAEHQDEQLAKVDGKQALRDIGDMMPSSIAICKETITTEKKDISAASCLHSASLHMNTVEQQRIEQADDKAVDMLYQAYAQIRAPPTAAPQALVAHPQ